MSLKVHIEADEHLILLDFGTGKLHVPAGVCDDNVKDPGQFGAPSDFTLCETVDPFEQRVPRVRFGDEVDESDICRNCLRGVSFAPRDDGHYSTLGAGERPTDAIAQAKLVR